MAIRLKFFSVFATIVCAVVLTGCSGGGGLSALTRVPVSGVYGGHLQLEGLGAPAGTLIGGQFTLDSKGQVVAPSFIGSNDPDDPDGFILTGALSSSGNYESEVMNVGTVGNPVYQKVTAYLKGNTITGSLAFFTPASGFGIPFTFKKGQPAGVTTVPANAMISSQTVARWAKK